MNPTIKIVAVALVVLGVAALVYGGFWYEKEETKAAIGPIQIKVEQRERVNIPVWAGVVSIGAGVGLLLWKRSGS